VKSFGFAKGLYNKFEFGIVDNYLNVRLPNWLITSGNSLVKSIQNNVLRDYIAVYASGIVILIVIVLIILSVV